MEVTFKLYWFTMSQFLPIVFDKHPVEISHKVRMQSHSPS